MNCWFCNNNTKVWRQQLNWWLCPHCEQYNGFSKVNHYIRFKFNAACNSNYTHLWLSRTPSIFTKFLSTLDSLSLLASPYCCFNTMKQAITYYVHTYQSFESRLPQYLDKRSKINGRIKSPVGVCLCVRDNLENHWTDYDVPLTTSQSFSKNALLKIVIARLPVAIS